MTKQLIILLTISNLIFSFERIFFQSANPFSLRDIIKSLPEQSPQRVFGNLTLPNLENTSKKIPLIIAVAGSRGWKEHHFEYLEMYQKMGIATFELNSFKSRNVSSTVGTQTEVTTAMMILDSYKALEILSNHPNIDIDNVAITGWSLGGGVTLFSGWKPLMDAIDSEYSFAAHLAFYPPCFVMPKNLEFTISPVHILIGEVDIWTPAAACKELINEINHFKYDFDITVYPESHHSFDVRDTTAQIIEEGYSFYDCRLKMNDYGTVVMNVLNIPMTTPLLQKIGLAFCADRGPIIGGNINARKQSFEFAKTFMNKHLIDN